MNVLVTGADGFIGSHLTELLLSEGHKVRALSQYNSFNFWGWIDDLKHKNLEIISGDIRDPLFCIKLCQDIDEVYHLAALIAIPYSYISPQSYIETNVTGTLNICQAALDQSVSKIFAASTSEVYGTAQYVPIDEKHPKQAQSPYSASKIGADMIALSFYNSFELPVTVVRPFNTYGPRQSMRAIIPSTIVQIFKGSVQIEVGDLSPTRDFNFIEDTCKGFVAISKAANIAGKEINISSNSEISMSDTLLLIAKLMGREVEFVQKENRIRPENSEVLRLIGDNSLLKSLVNYTPLTSLGDGLKKTIDWFSKPENLAKYKSDIYNL